MQHPARYTLEGRRLDVLQAENVSLGTANERLRAEKHASERNTAETRRKSVAGRDAARNNIKDLGARIAAMKLEGADREGRFRNQITALESEKNMLEARNGELEERVNKLEKVFKDTVGGFEAYNKGIRRAGE